MRSHSGVIAASFTPLAISGLQLWLKADAGLYQDTSGTTPAVADADPVGKWADQSGQGRNVTQSTSGRRPAMKAAIQNGLPAVRFTSAQTTSLKNTVLNLNGVTALMHCYALSAAGVAADQLVISAPGGGFAAEIYSSTIQGDVGSFSNAGSAAPFSTAPTIVSVVYDGSQTGNANRLKMWINGVQKTLTFAGTIPASISTTAGIWVGALPSNETSFLFDGDQYEHVVCTGSPSFAYREATENYLHSRWNVFIGNPIFVACDGNSLTFGAHSSNPTTKSYPPVMAGLLGNRYSVANYGISGQTTTQMTTYAAAHSDVAVASTAKSISIGWEVLNDIYFGATDLQAFSNYSAFLSQQRAAGFTKVIAVTAFDDVTETTQQRAYRLSANSMIRAHPELYDLLVDLASDSRFSDSTNETYFYTDHEHLNDNGYAVVASLMTSAVQSFSL